MTRVLVVGDAMLDSYKNCSVDRISPEAPVPVLVVKSTFERLGGAANVAAGIVAMGCDCDLVALTGDDAAGEHLRQLVGDAGIGDLTSSVSGRRTITKERIIGLGQQICRVDYDETFGAADSQILLDRARSSLAACDIVVFSDYGRGAAHVLQPLIQQSAEQGLRVLVDPKGADYKNYAGAWLVKPNWREFLAAAFHERAIGAGAHVEPEDRATIRALAHGLMERYDIAHMVITLGAKGYAHASREGEFVVQPTRAREVFDLSGAGDSFIATLAAFLANGAPVERAIDAGNMAAGLAVGRFGTTAIGLDDLSGFVDDREDDRSRIQKVKDLSRRGKRIVFTNGCFDLLHPGHLQLLQQAKSHGDVLVVGLNDDDSVRRLKGSQRPINQLADRAAMLQGLRSVDFVIPFAEDTPLRLVQELQPDVIIKGGDYSEETIVGADVVKARGGRVVVVPLVEGRSTTGIAERLASAAQK
jgi:D-beta-D-heptose 7-phosphate kinase/D-beta-D-heptose 1-phosphate adenosyltransferase